MNEDTKTYILKWIEKADNDYLSAKRLVEYQPLILDTACFHCQQAIEKYLKAYLVFLDIDFPKTHDLNVLLKLITDVDEFFNEIDFKDLPQFAVGIRYPDSYLIPEPDDVYFYIRLVEEVKVDILSKMNSILQLNPK